MQLTNLESKALNYMIREAMHAIGTDSPEDAKNDYCAPCSASELAKHCGTTTKVMRGVMSSMIKKGLCYLEEDGGAMDAMTGKPTGFDFWLNDEAFALYEQTNGKAHAETKAPAPMTPDELRETRRALGFPQQAFAELLGRNESTIRNWEAGRVTMPPELRLTLEGLKASLAD